MNPNTLRALMAATAAPWAMDRQAFDVFRRSCLMALTRAAGDDGRTFAATATGFHGPIDERGGEPEAAAIHPLTEKATARKAGTVAVIPVRGVITNRVSMFDAMFGYYGTPPGWVVAQVRNAMADEQIKVVVLEFDSPGGIVTGVPEAADALFAMRGKKPLVAQVVGSCQSAAYHLASACDEIDATPSAMIGSIGVYLNHVDFSRMNEMMGVTETYVFAGQYKVEGNDAEPLGDDARAHMQQTVNDYMALFVAAVARGRGVGQTVAGGERFGEGRSYIASRALERGMIDRVRTMQDTLLTYGADAAPAPTERRSRSLSLLRKDMNAMDLDV